MRPSDWLMTIGRQFAADPDPLAVGMGGAHGDVDQLQHRRVQAIGLAAGWDGQIALVPLARLPAAMNPGLNTDQPLVTDTTRIRQELGYAEADPTMDVDGTDAAAGTAPRPDGNGGSGPRRRYCRDTVGGGSDRRQTWFITMLPISRLPCIRQELDHDRSLS